MVSIIMSVYNNESTIGEAIDSILNQTLHDWELIICDDGSSDRTHEIVTEYSKADNRIRFFKNSVNSGLAYSLNRCLTKVRGEYIARMDGDDLSVPERLEIQLDFLEEHPEIDLVGTAMQVFDDSGNKEIIYRSFEPMITELPRYAPFSHATVMMKTSVLRSLNGYKVSKQTRRAEDMELWYRFYKEGFKGVNLSRPLYKVRVDENALKRRKLKYGVDAAIITFQGIYLNRLPIKYYLYSFKPLLSCILPESTKRRIRSNTGYKDNKQPANSNQQDGEI